HGEVAALDAHRAAGADGLRGVGELTAFGEEQVGVSAPALGSVDPRVAVGCDHRRAFRSVCPQSRQRPAGSGSWAKNTRQIDPTGPSGSRWNAAESMATGWASIGAPRSRRARARVAVTRLARLTTPPARPRRRAERTRPVGRSPGPGRTTAGR